MPVHVLSGFLGAGKTTLINRFLGAPFLSDAALIINEFGAIGVDHLLVEQSSDGIIELSDGCLCCTVRGALVDTLADLMDRRQTGRVRPFSRVLVETTGLADPGPVLQAIIGHPVLAGCYEFAGLVTVVDAVHGNDTLAKHEEARRQVRLADRLLISKSGMVGEMQRSALAPLLTQLNPRVAVLDGDDPDLTAEAVFSINANAGNEAAAVPAAAHAHSHGHDADGIQTESLVIDEAIAPEALMLFLDRLQSAHGPNLLRMKGIVKLSDRPERPLVVHAVQSIIAAPVRLAGWPEGADRKTRLVVIGKDLPAGLVSELFSALANRPGIDRPDSQALIDNPLAIPGGYTPGRG
ncbi:GTP-binding protein [Pseudohoeflea sp. DP4N28-3]|uniref:GTP-binding protein n=2 Tax=Pseudohoeflea coraliihabitans TaxID=2860393 RepID=A0ABS6WKR0_9HYPH|nr:GTP-binding protein [Pseudohoeflea sp. DP4N28-3]